MIINGQSIQQFFAIKQIKHYCANICFLFVYVITLHVSTLYWVIFRCTQYKLQLLKSI
jgi:hypothetical protein